MPRKIPRLLWLAVPLAYLLYFYHLDAAGIIGPDEPRYASIGREMARSGDWVTPRLWGQPWFEKPALLYWMTAAGFRLGLGTELAPRLPVALLAAAFLVFYWWIVRREFGSRPAWIAALILGTSGEWLAYSQVGVTDLPMTAAFAAAMLLALPWIARGERRYLPAAGALMGAAVLAKGLAPLALALPAVAVAGWRSLTKQNPGDAARPSLWDLARPSAVGPFLAVAVPWYLLCYLKNGSAFINEFFVKHHFSRVVSGELMHVQPWWYYAPVLAGALLPWTPLLPLAFRRVRGDARLALLCGWVLFGFVAFSLSVNKLPGYILPLLPAAALLMALGLEEAGRARGWLAASALLLVAFPVAAPILAPSLDVGLTKAPRPEFHWTWLAPLAVAAGVWALEGRGRRLAAVALVAAGATAGVLYVKQSAFPQVDRLASARSLWRQIEKQRDRVCLDRVDRDWGFGLNYYSVQPLPACAAAPKPMRVFQPQGQPPRLAPSSDPPVSKVDPQSHAVVISPLRN